MLIAWVRRQREWNFMLSAVIAVVLSLLNSAAIPIHIPGLEGIVEKLVFGVGIWLLAQGYHAVLTRINLFEATSQFPVVLMVLLLSAFPGAPMDWLFLGSTVLWICVLYNVLRAPGEVRSHAAVFNAGFFAGSLILLVPAYFYFIFFVWLYLGLSGPYSFRQGVITGLGYLLPPLYFICFDYILFGGVGSFLWLRSGLAPYSGLVSFSVVLGVVLGIWLLLVMGWTLASVRQNAGLKKHQRQVLQLSYLHLLSLMPLVFWLPDSEVRILSIGAFSLAVIGSFYFMIGPVNRAKDVLFWLLLGFSVVVVWL